MTTDNMSLEEMNAGYAEFTWADTLNSNFTIIDDHDHSYGNGIQLSSRSIKVLRDFPVNERVYNVSYLELNNVSSGSVSEIRSIFSLNGDLHYLDSNKRMVQITIGNSLNTESLLGGGFSGDYTTYGAECYYDSSAQIYNFTTDGATLGEVYSDTFNLSSYTSTPSYFEGVYANIGIVSASRSGIDFNQPAPSSGTAITGLLYNDTDSVWYTTSQETPILSVADSSSASTVYTSLVGYSGGGYYASYNETKFSFILDLDNFDQDNGTGYTKPLNTYAMTFSQPLVGNSIAYTSISKCAPFLVTSDIDYNSGASHILSNSSVNGSYGITGMDTVYGTSSFLYCVNPEPGTWVNRVSFIDIYEQNNVVTQVNPTYPGNTTTPSYLSDGSEVPAVAIQQLFLASPLVEGPFLQEFVCLSQGVSTKL